MKYENARLRQMLAAEYVLGTLRGRARRRFEKLAQRDTAVRTEITFWETRFAELSAGLAPVAPPPSIWLGLQHRVNIDAARVTPLRRPTPPPSVDAKATRPASFWRIGAGLATAAAIVVAVLIGQRNLLPGAPVVASKEAPPVVASVETPKPPAPPVVAPVPSPPAPTYVALLKLPKATLQWTLSLAPERGRVNIAATGEYARLGRHSLELWAITSGGPVSLGLLPVSGTTTLTLPQGLSAAEMQTLAISLEPVGGSPTGKPTGPVLTSGAAVKAA